MSENFQVGFYRKAKGAARGFLDLEAVYGPLDPCCCQRARGCGRSLDSDPARPPVFPMGLKPSLIKKPLED